MPKQPSHRRLSRPHVTVFTTVLVGAFMLSGCAGEKIAVTDAPAPESIVEEELPTLILGGTAIENEPFFQYTLLQFAASDSPVAGQPIVDSLVAAGFDRSQMQVTFDQSRTNLVADSILVSVQLGTDCVIGQVVTADRSVTTTVAPALTDAQKICLIGNTRPIDW